MSTAGLDIAIINLESSREFDKNPFDQPVDPCWKYHKVLIFVFEFIVRATGIAYEPQYDDRVRITRKSDNPIIGTELIPHFEGQALGGYNRINSFGVRGPEVSVEKPDGVTRIAVLGDSWAFGWGVDQDEVVTAVLEQFLNEMTDRSFEVLNFSRPSYNIQQQEIVLETRALRFFSDVVLFAFDINDLEGLRLTTPGEPDSTASIPARREPPGGAKARVWRAIQRQEMIWNRRSHLFRLFDRTARWLIIRSNSVPLGKSAYFNRFYEDDAPEFEFMNGAYARIRELGVRHGFDVHVVYCPWMAKLNDNNPYRATFGKVAVIAEQHGFHTLDLFPLFEGRDVNELRISKIDGHPTGLGHRIAAEAMAKHLLAQIDH